MKDQLQHSNTRIILSLTSAFLLLGLFACMGLEKQQGARLGIEPSDSTTDATRTDCDGYTYFSSSLQPVLTLHCTSCHVNGAGSSHLAFVDASSGDAAKIKTNYSAFVKAMDHPENSAIDNVYLTATGVAHGHINALSGLADQDVLANFYLYYYPSCVTTQ